MKEVTRVRFFSLNILEGREERRVDDDSDIWSLSKGIVALDGGFSLGCVELHHVLRNLNLNF